MDAMSRTPDSHESPGDHVVERRARRKKIAETDAKLDRYRAALEARHRQSAGLGLDGRDDGLPRPPSQARRPPTEAAIG
jgi:hypothetical protein